MISLIVKTSNDKDILLVNPYISSKDDLEFESSSIGAKSYYRKNTDYIKIVLNGFVYEFKIGQTEISLLNDFHKEELAKANNFLKNLKSNNIDLWFDESKSLCIKELLDTKYNNYYLKILFFILNKKFKTNFSDFLELEEFIKSKIDFKNYKKTDLKEYGEMYVIPLKEIL